MPTTLNCTAGRFVSNGMAFSIGRKRVPQDNLASDGGIVTLSSIYAFYVRSELGARSIGSWRSKRHWNRRFSTMDGLDPLFACLDHSFDRCHWRCINHARTPGFLFCWLCRVEDRGYSSTQFTYVRSLKCTSTC